MDIIKIRFAADFDHLGPEFERGVKDLFRSLGPGFSLAERSWKPPMDMNKNPEQVIIVAEVAGVDEEDLEVEITSKAVRIRATRHARHCAPNAAYRLAEIR